MAAAAQDEHVVHRGCQRRQRDGGVADVKACVARGVQGAEQQVPAVGDVKPGEAADTADAPEACKADRRASAADLEIDVVFVADRRVERLYAGQVHLAAAGRADRVGGFAETEVVEARL